MQRGLSLILRFIVTSDDICTVNVLTCEIYPRVFTCKLFFNSSASERVQSTWRLISKGKPWRVDNDTEVSECLALVHSFLS